MMDLDSLNIKKINHKKHLLEIVNQIVLQVSAKILYLIFFL